MKLVSGVITAAAGAAVGAGAVLATGGALPWETAASSTAQAEQPATAVPRLANGKPDFSGLWQQPPVQNMARDQPPTRGGGPTELRLTSALPEGDDLPYTDWGREQWQAYNPVVDGDYAGSCFPFGMSRSINSPWPTQIIQNENALAFLWEQNTWFHWVPMDGRQWPADMPPSWTGYSVAYYEGDTLVVETTNFNGWTKLDTIGHPHSDQLRIVQTFERPVFERIDHTVTIHDPVAYTEPWSNVRSWNLRDGADEFIMEYSCMENNAGLFDGSITPWTPPGW